MSDQWSRLGVMNFLNEAAADFPHAISFASGRPAEQFFNIQEWIASISVFGSHAAKSGIVSMDQLGQYGRTNGIINDLVACQLQTDEGLHCRPEDIVITAGCQEALALCIAELCHRPGDVLLARNPTYIGATGVADYLGVETFPLNGNDGGDWSAQLDNLVDDLSRRGKRPRALYLTPDFDNPTGSLLSASEREAILAICAGHEIVVLEDNPYGMFRFEGQDIPKMASLDRFGVVLYLSTYSKTLCPTLRVGAIVLPNTLFGNRKAAKALKEAISQRKSFVTVNTSQITQAIVGGVLLRNDCSLQRIVDPALCFYRENRDILLRSLDQAFTMYGQGVSWNKPMGGFFLTLTLPFEFGKEEMLDCSRVGVIVMPTSFFSLDDSHRMEVRLAFSNVSSDKVAAGVKILSDYTRSKITGLAA